MGSLSAIQQYCLRWNNHRSNLLLVFEHLFLTEAFTDVTLACDGESIKCHKMVLAACSSYFQHLFMTNDCRHPIVILKDIRFSEIKAILEYMYKGEVNVAQDQLAGLLKAAETLKVKGLVEDNQSVSETPTPPNQSPYPNSTAPPEYIPTSTYINKTNSLPTTRITAPADSIFDSPYNSNSVPDRNVLPYPLWSSSSSSSNKNPMATSPKHGVSTVSFENSHNEPVLLKKKKMLSANKDTPILRTVLGHTSLQTNNAENSTKPLKTVNYTLPGNPTNGSTPSSDTNDTPRADSPEHFLDDSGRSDLMEKVHGDNHSFTMEGEEKSGGGIATYVPSQKPEWKRYKQYTRTDIMAAIDAVKGGMSALQAARKYGVPSRTLYDKVKKLGITTNRPYRKGSFPMSPYQGLSVKMEESSGYSPEDGQMEGGGGNGNGLRHGMEGDSSKVDSESGLSMKDQGSPIYERECSNPSQGPMGSGQEPKRSGQNNVTASEISSSTTSPEAMDFIEPEGFMSSSNNMKRCTPTLNVC